MKKVLLIVGILVLCLSISAFGQGVKSKVMISGYGGFTKGYGDAFPHESDGHIAYYFDTKFNAGGMVHYGFTDKFMLGAEIGYQRYSEEFYGGGLPSAKYTYNNFNFLINGLYVLNQETSKQLISISFGSGIYSFGEGEDGFSDLGLFAGLYYNRMISSSLGLFIMPRFHYVLSDEVKPQMLTISLGLSYL